MRTRSLGKFGATVRPLLLSACTEHAPVRIVVDADSGFFVVVRRACPRCGRPTATIGVELSALRVR
jgi:hypothetical protein